ncbi:hypothetical protein [Alteromonas gracilis]|uniref:hypothetical protein n=1 Tax=Alteromonas gracilis TaxID=1479524 RepID=UPI0037370127
MNKRQLKSEMFVEICERTMATWLPVRKSITEVPFNEKCKFWYQLWAPIFVSFIAVVALDWIGIFIAIALNFWWFGQWNRYLKACEAQSSVNDRQK